MSHIHCKQENQEFIFWQLASINYDQMVSPGVKLHIPLLTEKKNLWNIKLHIKQGSTAKSLKKKKFDYCIHQC